MFVEPYGKALFLELCSRLYGLKLVTKETLQDDSQVESVSFFFRKEILEEVNHSSLQNEVATVRYNGVKINSVFTQVAGVTLRLYVAPLSALGIDDILEPFKAYRSELKGPPNSSYYNYVFVDPFSSIEVSQCIDGIFTQLDDKIKNRLHSVQDILPIAEIPEGIIRIVAEPALA